MKTINLFLLIFTFGFCNFNFSQNSSDLDSLIKLNPIVYSNYTLSDAKQIPTCFATKIYGGLEYFTICLNGNVAVLPLKDNEIQLGKKLLKNKIDSTFNNNNSSFGVDLNR